MKENAFLFSSKGESTLPRARAKYLTQSIALEEQGPSGIISSAVFLSLLLLIASIVWASITIVSETASAPGEVVPAGHSLSVQHLEGGLVKKLNVRDGDNVQKNDLLLTLDDTLLRSELEQVKVRKAVLGLQAERLAALLEQREPVFGSTSKHYVYLANKQRTIYLAQRKSHTREIEVVESQIRQKQQELIRQRNLVTSREKEILPLKEQLTMQRKLTDKKLAPKKELLIMQTRLAETESNLFQAKDSVVVATSALEEAMQRKLKLEAGFFKEIEIEAGKLATELAEITQTLIRIQDRVRRLKIFAPVDGIVQGLNVNSGQVVIERGQVIMQIIPVGDEMVVNAEVSPADIGHVQEGSRADIRIDSYDTVRFGLLEGTVRRISASTYLDEKKQPYYRAEIVLKKNHLGSDERPLRIIPGMTVVADIRTGEKSLMDYLLRPIRRGLDTSFGER